MNASKAGALAPCNCHIRRLGCTLTPACAHTTLLKPHKEVFITHRLPSFPYHFDHLAKKYNLQSPSQKTTPLHLNDIAFIPTFFYTDSIQTPMIHSIKHTVTLKKFYHNLSTQYPERFFFCSGTKCDLDCCRRQQTAKLILDVIEE